MNNELLQIAFAHELQAQADRQNRTLSPINLAVSKVLYTTAVQAMTDTAAVKWDKTFKVVSAPTGSSKTNSAIAFAAAAYKTIPGFSCSFVVEEIKHAQEIYEALLDTLPSEAVRVWSSYHDPKSRNDDDFSKYLFTPTDSTIDQMKLTPITIWTHRKWLSEVKYDGDSGVRKFKGKSRDVMFIDEQPQAIEIMELTPADIGKRSDDIARMNPDHPWVKTLSDVERRMKDLFETDGDETVAVELFHCLEALGFTEEKARAVWGEYYHTQPPSEFLGAFKFLHACTLGYVFFTRRKPRSFVAYLPSFKPEPNLVLLDATADISGLSQLLGGKLAKDMPQIDYSNLSLHHLQPPPEFKLVSEVVRSRPKAIAYADWINQTVMTNTQVGDHVLVVLHKAMVETHALFPHRPGDPDDSIFLGRHTHIIWWGQGIGSNQYKAATKVFLFSEFYQPRRVTIATTLGATQTQASGIDFKKLNGRLSGDFLTIQEGDLLRWTKQLACRGNVRNISEDGTCGAMDVYTSMDFRRLIRNLSRLFPGAKAPIKLETTRVATKGRAALIDLLSTTAEKELSSSVIQELTGVKSKHLRGEIESESAKPILAAYGWNLVAAKSIGKAGKSSYLVRS